MRRLLLPILILAAVASACSLTVGSKTPSDTTSPASTLNTTPIPVSNEPVEAVVQRVLPAVVNVTTDIAQGAAEAARGSGRDSSCDPMASS